MIQPMMENVNENLMDLFFLESKCETALHASSNIADIYWEKAEFEMLSLEYQARLEGIEYSDEEYTEAADGALTKAANAVKNIIDSVVTFISNAITAISKKITQAFNKNAVTPEDYVKSDTFKAKINMQYVETFKEIDKHMTTGEVLLRKSASKVGIDQNAVSAYRDMVRKFIDSIPPVAVTALKVGGAVGGVIILRKNYKKIAELMVSVMDKCSKKMTSLKKFLSKDATGTQKEIVTSMSSLAKTKASICSKISGSLAAIETRITSKTVNSVADAAKKMSFKDYYDASPDANEKS